MKKYETIQICVNILEYKDIITTSSDASGLVGKFMIDGEGDFVIWGEK